MKKRLCSLLLASAFVVAGCAKKPVLYHNETYRDLGEPAVNEVVEACMEEARAADVADSRSSGASKGAVAGAAIGAVLWGAVGWIFGNPGRSAAAGAASGGGGGAIRGAASSGESAQTFRGYVEACLRHRGLEPVGWR